MNLLHFCYINRPLGYIFVIYLANIRNAKNLDGFEKWIRAEIGKQIRLSLVSLTEWEMG